MTITFSSDYVPYGSNYGASGKEVFMYTGKWYDSATGLYCECARYYDTSLGRLVTQAFSSGNMANPISMNLYSYSIDSVGQIDLKQSGQEGIETTSMEQLYLAWQYVYSHGDGSDLDDAWGAAGGPICN